MWWLKRRRFRWPLVWLVLLAATAFAPSGLAASDDVVVERLREMVVVLDRVETAVRADDQAAARSAYQGYRDGWSAIEDEVRPRARDAYREIESQMRNVNTSLRGQPLNTAEALSDIGNLRAASLSLIERFPATKPSGSSASGPAGMTQLMAELDAAAAALGGGAIPEALARIDRAQDLWPDVEGVVKVKSPGAYAAVENNLALAEASLRASPADVRQATAALESLRRDLQPYAEESLSYNAFDAGITLVREGLEALLIITGLLALVKRTGAPRAQTWVWGGAALGIAASVVVAVILGVVFTQLATGTSRELLEGIVGLLAAAMLVYMSYWLHSKANLDAWRRYVGERTSTALARNSLISLALIAFLAVFREGGETTLFLIGMAPSIAWSDLVLGLAVAAALLLVIGVALVGFGLRVPLRPFFLGASLLIYYLAFKFVGASIHALQVAGVASATPAPVPPIELVGLYPTWETTLPQIALLGAALVWFVISRLPERQASLRHA